MDEPERVRAWIVLPIGHHLAGWGPLGAYKSELENDGYTVAVLHGADVTLRLSGMSLTPAALAYEPRPRSSWVASAPPVLEYELVKPELCRAIADDIAPSATVRQARSTAEMLGRDGQWYRVVVTGWVRDRWGRWTCIVDGSASQPAWSGAYIHNPGKLRPAAGSRG